MRTPIDNRKVIQLFVTLTPNPSPKPVLSEVEGWERGLRHYLAWGEGSLARPFYGSTTWAAAAVSGGASDTECNGVNRLYKSTWLA